MRHRSSLIGLIALGLAGCQGATEAESNAADTPGPAAATSPNGLTAAEEAALKQEVIQVIGGRTWVAFWRDPTPCSEVFAFEEPQIVGTSLGPQTGRIRVIVPTKGVNPLYREHYAEKWFYPAKQCFGVREDVWAPELTIPITFDFALRRWSSGWQLDPQGAIR